MSEDKQLIPGLNFTAQIGDAASSGTQHEHRRPAGTAFRSPAYKVVPFLKLYAIPVTLMPLEVSSTGTETGHHHLCLSALSVTMRRYRLVPHRSCR